ncbi:MAG: S-methyl-5'-thioadenosine phosphorylase [Pyrodictiaceae archaeon]
MEWEYELPPIPKVKADVAVIGGSGLYDPGILEDTKELKIYTPYGEPSSNIVIGKLGSKIVAFLPRHGKGHRIPPHKINYRANIWALKTLGVSWVISVSAVGSLREDYKPGDLVVPDQFIDMTKNRVYTFFDGPVVAHVSMADPFCEHLRRLLIDVARNERIRVHEKGTYLCIEGPRFSTRAESTIWREVFRADIIGMTLVPEVNLACEAQLCYAVLALVTDYDVWADRPVTAEEVERVMKENIEKAKRVLYKLIPSLPNKPKEELCSCCKALQTALL